MLRSLGDDKSSTSPQHIGRGMRRPSSSGPEQAAHPWCAPALSPSARYLFIPPVESTTLESLSYAGCMSGPATPLTTLLRASLLVLLVLGMLVKPVLNHVGELHAVEHAALAVCDHGHDGSDHDCTDSGPDTDHAQGAHSLMHSADAGASTGICISSTSLPTAAPDSVLPMPDTAAVHPQHPISLFRPPIA